MESIQIFLKQQQQQPFICTLEWWENYNLHFILVEGTACPK